MSFDTPEFIQKRFNLSCSENYIESFLKISLNLYEFSKELKRISGGYFLAIINETRARYSIILLKVLLDGRTSYKMPGRYIIILLKVLLDGRYIIILLKVLLDGRYIIILLKVLLGSRANYKMPGRADRPPSTWLFLSIECR